MKILIVEDDPASLKLAALVLVSEGHEVTRAISAEAAVESIAENQPQVIMLDIALPGADGFMLANRLKQCSPTSNIPILAVTAYPARFPREQAFAAGCDSYLIKPLDTRKLSAQVTGLVKSTGTQSKADRRRRSANRKSPSQGPRPARIPAHPTSTD